jgi:phenylacetate-CoA ligase
MRVAAEQDRALARYIAEHVYPYSPWYRPRLEAAGLGRRTPVAALPRLAPTSLADVDDPSQLVLRPDDRLLQRYGNPGLVLRLTWARLTGQGGRETRRLLDPVYKPVHWHVDQGLLIASSHQDLDRLGERGRRMLVHAGVRTDDTVVGALPPGPHLPYWQAVLGCRRAGVSALHLPPVPSPAQLHAAAPSVLIARGPDLEAALSASGTIPGLRVVIAAGTPLDTSARLRLAGLAPGATIVASWAPPGVRAMWAECPGGALHTWPDSERLEVVDPDTGLPVSPGEPGEVLWSGIGWMGTAWLRLRTGITGRVEAGICSACGRTTPRVLPGAGPRPRLARLLDSSPALAGWLAERRSVNGTEELIVFVTLADPSGRSGHPGPALRALDAQLGVTQFVVVDPPELERRLIAAAGNQIVDLP